jgi:serine/threonine protein kinase
MLINRHAVVKLSDFGTCCEITETDSMYSNVLGTIAYFPPEVVSMRLGQVDISSRPTAIQVDMWALGISLVEIINGKHPCLGLHDFDQYSKIAEWNPEVPAKVVSNQIETFILYL